MKELFRDTSCGHILRLLSDGKLLRYSEEENPDIWRRYVDKEKSARMAQHGHTEEEDKDVDEDSETPEGEESDTQQRHEQNTQQGTTASNNRPGNQERQRNEGSGVMVDPEKGKDATIVTWYSDNDPDVRTIMIYPK